jgi:hypothetical protein
MKYELRYVAAGFFIEGANRSRYYIPFNQFACVETCPSGSVDYMATVYLHGGKLLTFILDTEADARAFMDDIASNSILYAQPTRRRD